MRSRDMVAKTRDCKDRLTLFADWLTEDQLLRLLDWTAGTIRSGDGPKVSGGMTQGLEAQIVDESCDETDRNKSGIRDRRDPFELMRLALISDLESIHQALTRLEATRRKMSTMSVEEARRLAEEEGATTWECSNPACRQVFVYTANTRPRAGQCAPCFSYWNDQRHPGTYRPHRLIHREPMAACDDCSRIYEGAA